MTTDYWNSKADDYERRLWEVVGRDDLKTALDAVQSIEERGRAADFGCGTGLFTRYLARGADEVFALDTSEAMLESARRKLNDVDNVQWLQASCLQTGLPDESMDTVLMANVLQLVEDRDRAVAEAARVLRPNGELVVLAWTGTGMSLWNRLTMMWRYLRHIGFPPPGARNLSPEQARSLAESNGFIVEDLELVGSRVKCLHMTARKPSPDGAAADAP
jgi:ubiquinone/menaquinone biosynthesis C-methylase UbiE